MFSSGPRRSTHSLPKTNNRGLELEPTKLRRLLAVAASVLVLGGVVAACGVEGTPLPSEEKVDTSMLSPGPYRTVARVAPESSVGPDVRWLREAQRMAGYIPDPVDIDSELTTKTDPTGVLRNGASLVNAESGGIGANDLGALADVAGKYHFLGGFSTARGNDQGVNSRYLVNSLLRFPDPESAARAAMEMKQAVMDWNNNPKYSSVTGLGPPTDVAVRGYPDARAFYFPTGMVSSWYATGPLVAHTVAVDPEKPADAVSQRVTKALDAQADLLRDFVPTAAENLSTLTIDRDGILARTLAFREGQSINTSQEAYYSARGILHFAENGTLYRNMLRDNGVDLAAYNNAVVLRARDREGAWHLQSGWLQSHRKGYDGYDPQIGQPAITCVKKRDSHDDTAEKLASTRFQCAITFGRYMAEVSSGQELDIKQRASAQLALLVNNP